MRNNPINTNSFRFFLRFVSLEFTELYEITEPVGFDVANFILKQDSDRYARDIVYGCDNTELTFYDCSGFAKTGKEQIVSPNGRISEYLDMGVEWILQTFKRFGFESEIEFVLFKDNLEFTVGMLDLSNPNTDEKTFFGLQIIQNTQVADYKRHEGTTINLHSTKNVRNETITPVETIDFLRKAVEIEVVNTYSMPKRVYEKAGYIRPYLNYSNIQNIVQFKDTKQFNEKGYYSRDLAIQGYVLVDAKSFYRDLKIKVETDFKVLYRVGSGSNVGGVKVRLWVAIYTDPFNTLTVDDFVIYEKVITGNNEQLVTIDPLIEYEISNLSIGQKISVYWKFSWDVAHVEGQTFFDFTKIDVKLTGLETSLDTIVTGVRYIEAMKQCSKFINNLPVDANRWQIGKEFYNQFLFNRSGISQNKIKPFNTNFSEILGSVNEVNGDYEILNNKIFVGHYEDFYVKNEIAVFKIIPSKEKTVAWLERFKINLWSFGYKTFEQNRLSVNTAYDIHTQVERIIGNLKVENKKDVEVDLVRSGYSQQIVTDLEIKNPSTSNENDDKVYIVDVIPLENGYVQTFSANLQMGIFDGKLSLYNKETAAKEEDSLINWARVGITLGQTFYIESGQSSGTYTVLEIKQTALVLNPIGFTPSFQGDSFVKISFQLQNIVWQTRTNEEFAEIKGIANANRYPNLKYSIARNEKHWHSFLKTAISYCKNKILQTSYFKNDIELETRLSTEIALLKEKANLDIPESVEKILSGKSHRLTVYAGFYDVLDFLEQLKIERGFVRCYGLENEIIKGFVKDLDYTWKTAELVLEIEELFEEEVFAITYANGILTINNVKYDVNGNVDWFKCTALDYFQFYDKNSVPITNIIYYKFVFLNGVFYDNSDDLVNALVNL